MPQAVRIVEHDPQWPEDYEEEKQRILEVISNRVLAIDHIGSTSVPGLGGKPIIDIMAGVKSTADAEECLPLLMEIGYDDVTPEPQEPDWHYCLGKSPAHPRPSFRYFHLHLVNFGSPHWEKHLLFRDHLRTHPEVAQEYYELKKRLAAKHGSDRVEYAEAKTFFIESIVTKARRLKTSHA